MERDTKAMKQKAGNQRDQELEVVIAKLGADATRASASMRDHYEQLLSDLRSSHRGEKEELQRELQGLEQKYENVRESGNALERLTGQLHEAHADCSRMEQEKRTLMERLRSLEAARNAGCARCIHMEGELQRMEQNHQEEISQLHQRVKNTVGKKEETIDSLRSQVLAQEMRLKETEQVLEKHRRDLLQHLSH